MPGWLSSRLALGQIATKFVDAKDYAPLLRQCVDKVKGEPWGERGEATDLAKLSKRLEAYEGDTLPDAVRLIRAGVDTQDDRLEVTFMGCGNGEEAWTIGHQIILGDTGRLALWAALDQRLRETVLQTEFGKPLRVRATCINSGGHRGSMVLGCARTRTARRIYAADGVPNAH